jgi:hypothetical protein
MSFELQVQLLARSGASLCSLATGAVWHADRTTRIIITQRQKTVKGRDFRSALAQLIAGSKQDVTTLYGRTLELMKI